MPDVEIHAPVAGKLTWLPVLAGVPDELVAAIERTCLWELRCVPCAGATPSNGTESSATAVEPRPTRATEHDVWMSYPRQNQMHPWGLIARGVTPEESRVWQRYAARRLSVQPPA